MPTETTITRTDNPHRQPLPNEFVEKPSDHARLLKLKIGATEESQNLVNYSTCELGVGSGKLFFQQENKEPQRRVKSGRKIPQYRQVLGPKFVGISNGSCVPAQHVTVSRKAETNSAHKVIRMCPSRMIWGRILGLAADITDSVLREDQTIQARMYTLQHGHGQAFPEESSAAFVSGAKRTESTLAVLNGCAKRNDVEFARLFAPNIARFPNASRGESWAELSLANTLGVRQRGLSLEQQLPSVRRDRMKNLHDNLDQQGWKNCATFG
ncbi:hypothetical protein V8E55_008291 [Tylopilus felleus]